MHIRSASSASKTIWGEYILSLFSIISLLSRVTLMVVFAVSLMVQISYKCTEYIFLTPSLDLPYTFLRSSLHLSDRYAPHYLSLFSYFPMQKRLKILVNTSCEVIRPVISPKYCKQSCRSIERNSPLNPASMPASTRSMADKAC